MLLVRPLLAVIVLVVNVRVGAYLNNCIQKDIGQWGDYINEYSEELSYGKNPDTDIVASSCSPFKLVGEVINVCNNDSNNTETANIDGPLIGHLTPVNITCHEPSGCTAFVTLRCKV